MRPWQPNVARSEPQPRVRKLDLAVASLRQERSLEERMVPASEILSLQNYSEFACPRCCQAPVSSNPNAASSGGGRVAASVESVAKALKTRNRTERVNFFLQQVQADTKRVASRPGDAPWTSSRKRADVRQRLVDAGPHRTGGSTCTHVGRGPEINTFRFFVVSVPRYGNG